MTCGKVYKVLYMHHQIIECHISIHRKKGQEKISPWIWQLKVNPAIYCKIISESKHISWVFQSIILFLFGVSIKYFGSLNMVSKACKQLGEKDEHLIG